MKIANPKKSLGQNFLIDKNILEIIVNTVDIKKNDTILEVGPGTGKLTEQILLKKPKKVFVIEKDKLLSEKLHEKFKKKIIIINDDILNVEEEKYSDQPMIVFGNLPYNISTQILIKWIRYNNLNNIFKNFVLMFQKEVAERIISEINTKNYGRLSILSSWKLKIKKIADVSPNSFYPKPKVKSTILLIEPKNEYFKLKNTKNLEHITNIFFNQRRKMIKKPLNIIFKNVDEISKKLGINISDRPQNLSALKYFEICKEYENLTS
tara:strand:- start:219 stop:1013 length:795 start_codon:yes stop_codon:yes gene_type:complete